MTPTEEFQYSGTYVVTCGFRVPNMAYRITMRRTDSTQNGTFWQELLSSMKTSVNYNDRIGKCLGVNASSRRTRTKE